MLGRLALGLLRGLGKGMCAAGGGGMASGLLRSAVAASGRKNGGNRGGMGRGGGCRKKGRGQTGFSLEEAARGLLAERRTDIAGPENDRERPLEATVIDVRPEERPTPVMPDEETALRCLAAHVTSFTEGRVRLRHPALHVAAGLEELRRQLLTRPGVRDVTFNPVTGSALLLYDAGQLDRLGLLAAALPLGFFLASTAALPAASDDSRD